jgi:tRNA threonylcarbamoyladenosine biosynthesis protein TsaB
MTGILAMETSTDACSLALGVGGTVSERHEVAPRAHSQRLFQLLEELLAGRDLVSLGVDHIAYGSGPGSFTGLRIAASAAQGLAFAAGVSAVPVPTLAVLAQVALRTRAAASQDTVLATIDARINEVYAAVYHFDGGLPQLVEGPWACRPQSLSVSAGGPLVAIGSGCLSRGEFDRGLAARVTRWEPTLLPTARDMLPLAADIAARGGSQSPEDVAPVYVRDEISWKKVHEQVKSG